MIKRRDYVDEIIKNETGKLQLNNANKYKEAFNILFAEGVKVRVTLAEGILQVKLIDTPKGVL